MEHIEIHVARTEEHARTLEYLNLIEFAMDEYCEHCAEQIGYTEFSFIPCAVVLDEDTEFLICLDCLAPILSQGA